MKKQLNGNKRKYRWNKRKCAENLVTLAVMTAGGVVLGLVFALWAMA